MSFLDHRGFRLGFAVVALSTAFAGEALRYSISWYGFIAVALAITIVAALIVAREHKRGTWAWRSLPYPLIAFLALATLSITWSFYPSATLLGLGATWAAAIVGLGLAVSLSWADFLTALGRALRIVLGASFVFELVVSLFIRGRLLPLFAPPGIDYSKIESVPSMLYWSRNLLLEGGKIQGIMGNSSLLGFVALLALIVFSIQWGARTTGRITTLLWMSLALVAIVLTKSATIIIAVVVLAVIIATVVLLRRVRRTHRKWVWIGLGAVIAATAAASIAIPATLLATLGKSPDLTERLGIWENVTHLAVQRPGFGWGWVSYWVPWVAPFDSLVVNSGVRQLHAHNAWLDVFLQLGMVGDVVFAALVVSTAMRSILFAADHPVGPRGEKLAFTVQSYLAVLVIFALLVQTIAESRILVEYGIVLLVFLAVKTKATQSMTAAP